MNIIDRINTYDAHFANSEDLARLTEITLILELAARRLEHVEEHAADLFNDQLAIVLADLAANRPLLIEDLLTMCSTVTTACMDARDVIDSDSEEDSSSDGEASIQL